MCPGGWPADNTAKQVLSRHVHIHTTTQVHSRCTSVPNAQTLSTCVNCMEDIASLKSFVHRRWEKSWLVCPHEEGDPNDVYTVAVEPTGRKQSILGITIICLVSVAFHHRFRPN